MIGIMDWGIGGLSVYKALRSRGLTTDVTYLSDSGATPYGKMNRQELRYRLSLIAGFFKKRGIRNVYVACNAASSVLDSDVEIFSEVSFYSIIPASVTSAFNSLKNNQIKNIGVIGGNLTIESQIYQKRFAENLTQFKFLSAQPLSGFVEAGQLSGPQVETSVKDILRQLGNIDALLLACTHYPALNPLFQKINPSLQLLDPAISMVEDMTKREQKFIHSSLEPSLFHFFTTGNLDKTQNSAKLAFKVDTKHGQQISLPAAI